MLSIFFLNNMDYLQHLYIVSFPDIKEVFTKIRYNFLFNFNRFYYNIIFDKRKFLKSSITLNMPDIKR